MVSYYEKVCWKICKIPQTVRQANPFSFNGINDFQPSQCPVAYACSKSSPSSTPLHDLLSLGILTPFLM